MGALARFHAAACEGCSGQRQPRRVDLAQLDSLALSTVSTLLRSPRTGATTSLRGVAEFPTTSRTIRSPLSTESGPGGSLPRDLRSRPVAYLSANEDSQVRPRSRQSFDHFPSRPDRRGGRRRPHYFAVTCCVASARRATSECLAPPASHHRVRSRMGNLTNDLSLPVSASLRSRSGEQFCTLMRQSDARSRPTSRSFRRHAQHSPRRAPTTRRSSSRSFHHCSDHLAQLRNSIESCVRARVVFFASGPVTEMPYPWGPRLGGLSLWSTRTNGWLELGFDGAYFEARLARTGWKAERRILGRVPGNLPVCRCLGNTELARMKALSSTELVGSHHWASQFSV